MTRIGADFADKKRIFLSVEIRVIRVPSLSAVDGAGGERYNAC